MTKNWRSGLKTGDWVQVCATGPHRFRQIGHFQLGSYGSYRIFVSRESWFPIFEEDVVIYWTQLADRLKEFIG